MIPLPAAIPDLTPRSPFAETGNDDYLRMISALREADGDPDRLPQPLAMRYRHHLAQNIVKEKVCREVIRRLQEGGVTTALPIKGVHLLQTLYRDVPGIRPMVDIDILVPRADFRKVPAIVRQTPGWHPVMERWLEARSFLAADIVFVTHQITVEVKRDLLLVPLADFGSLFAGAETTLIAGTPVRIPRFEHALLVFLVHHVGDLLHYRRIEPRHLAEFSVMLASFGDIAAFRETCRVLRLERWCDLMFFLIYTFFEHPVVAAADFAIHPVFTCIEKKAGECLGIRKVYPLLSFLYRQWTLPLLLRNALLFFPKKALKCRPAGKNC